MARLRFGAEKRSRFPYWVIPTVIFVFGIGMLAGRAIESDLTLAELRTRKLTVSDLLERLWPKRNEGASPLPARTVVLQTEAENRLKSENARLIAEKDALVEQLQTLKGELTARDDSIKGLRGEINELAQANRKLLEQSKEYEKFKRNAALKEAERERAVARTQSARATTSAAASNPSPAATTDVAAQAVTSPAQAAPEPRRGPSYQVLRRTPLLRNPSENAQILYYLSPGRRVNVGGIVNGRFLRVQYSRSGNPPGYVLVTDVTPLE